MGNIIFVTVASLFNTIILFGCVQGFIVAALLWFGKTAVNRYANRLLAALLILMSLACFNLYGSSVNWFGSRWLMLLQQIVPLVIVMPIGPLLFFYTRSSLDPAFRLGKTQKRQFYAILVDLVPGLTVIIYIVCLAFRLIHKNPFAWSTFIDTYNVYADIPRWASLTVYTVLSYRLLRRVKLAANGQAPKNLQWLLQFAVSFIVFQSLWLVYLIPYVIPKYTDWMLDVFGWYPVYIPIAVLIYWLGLKGYIESLREKEIAVQSSPRTSLPPAELMREAADRLVQLMENDLLYLRPDLTIGTLSAAAGYPSKLISATLNQHLNSNFNDFVNRYRMRAFIEKIRQPGMNALTIAGIAFECGFNSLATFQRTCREMTGQSPSAFRKNTATAIIMPVKPAK